MAWLAIGSGLALGLGSVAHCAGMCGPIAMVLPFQKENGRYDWLSFSVYHAGRMSAYLSIGLLIGWLGEMIRWQGLGGFLSLISGIALLLYGMQYAGWVSISRSPEILPAHMLKNVWYRAIQSPNKAWFFPAGVANGLLPCGMVYAAATVALGMSHFNESIGVMLGFAAGTLPVFLVLPLVRRYIGGRKITPWIMIAAALWLIIRGGTALYALAQQKATSPMCHGADFTSF